MIPTFGKGLKFFTQVAIIPIGSDGDTTTDGGIKLTGVLLPLLEGVVLEELLVEIPTDLGNNDLLGVRGVLNGYAILLKPRLKLLAGAPTTKELLEGVEIDREVPVSAG